MCKEEISSSLQVKKHYNLVMDSYIDFLKRDDVKKKDYDIRLLDRFASYFDNNSRICDVGCGPEGHIGKYLFDKGFGIIGTDISDKCISNAKELNPAIDFMVMDMCYMDFPDEYFNGIVAFYSIIHIPKPHLNQAYSEICRVLRKGGKLLLAVHKGNGEHSYNEVWGHKTELLVNWYTESELEKCLLDNSFKILFLESRKPYDFEVQTERIYAIAEKI